MKLIIYFALLTLAVGRNSRNRKKINDEDEEHQCESTVMGFNFEGNQVGQKVSLFF